MKENQEVPWSEVLKDWADIIWTAIVMKWKFFIGNISFSIHGPDDVVKGISPRSHIGVISEDDPFWKKRIEAARKKKEEEEKKKKEEKEKKREKWENRKKKIQKILSFFYHH